MKRILLKLFFGNCHNKTATNSEYKDALESAEKLGISREWIDYAYNNQGDEIRNIQSSSYNIELTSPNGPCWKLYIPLAAKITSEDKNFYFNLEPDIEYEVCIETDSDDPNVAYREVTMNPEGITFRYEDEDGKIPEEVQLPFGMVLKHVEDPYTVDYFINQGYSQEEAIEYANAWNNGVIADCVIEWQGQSFNCDELRKYILNNTKIVYNGQTVNLNLSQTSGTSGEELDDLFGINYYDLDINGYLNE